MRPRSDILPSPSRLARLIAWLLAMLNWVAGPRRPGRRLARFAWLTSDVLVHAVRNLILIRAAGMLAPREPPARRNYAPPGFRRRLNPRALRRAAGGVRLRRAVPLKASCAELTAALRSLDRIAARIARYLTRLRPMLLRHPPQTHATTLFSPSACAHDSS